LKVLKTFIFAIIAMMFIQVSHAQLSVYSSNPLASWTPVTDILDNNGNPIGDSWSFDAPEAGIFQFLTGTGAWVGYQYSPNIPLSRIEYWALNATTPDPSFALVSFGDAKVMLLAEWAGSAGVNSSGYRMTTGIIGSLFLGPDQPGALSTLPGGTSYLNLTSPAGVFDSQFGGTVQNVFLARDRLNPNVIYGGFEDLNMDRREPDFQDHVVRFENVLESESVPEPSTYGAIGFMVMIGAWVVLRRK